MSPAPFAHPDSGTMVGSMRTIAEQVAGMDADQALDAVALTRQQRRAAEVTDLLLLSHWAMLHAAPADDQPGQRRRTTPGGDKPVHLGGEGTPAVWQLAMAEIALERQVHPYAVDRATGDVLDLQHRLPATWAVAMDLEAEVWVARRVAAMTHHLPLSAVGIVDSAVAAAISGYSPARVLRIAEAKVIEADPEAHAAAIEATRTQRFFRVGRPDEHGLATVNARLGVGEAHALGHTVRAVHAALNPPDPDARHEADPDHDAHLATAFGWLARPAEAHALLAGADPAAQTRHRPHALLHVHLHQAVLDGTVPGVARVEELGPMLPAEALEFLATATQVHVHPVIDLRDQIRADAYEHPEALKHRLRLTTGGDVYPWAANTGLRYDYDHVIPYDPHGPPGQTGTHNSAVLTRRHHRIKTHTAIGVQQTGPGAYEWTTPRGRAYLVDHTGTRPAPSRVKPDVWHGLPVGVDYPAA